MNSDLQGPTRRVQSPRSSCLGCLGSIIVVPLFAYVLAGPVTFHLGGRWTPTGHWTGVGRMRDSAGAQYGLYVQFWASPNIDIRNEATTCCELSGKSQVCTAGGARYQFGLTGSISGAWLRTEGAKVNLSLAESGRPKVPRVFQLSGVWRGPELLLDDQKSLFMNFQPGGNLVPKTTYTAPVPDNHATVVLSWGDPGAFESICGSIRNSNH